MKLIITRVRIIKVMNTYQVSHDGKLVGTFYNKKDAKEFADMLNKMYGYIKEV